MKKQFGETVEKGRIKPDRYPPTERGDRCGVFFVRSAPCPKDHLMIIASDGDGWEHSQFPPPAFEHVSVTVRTNGEQALRCPTWEEMDWVCRLFWGPEEAVLQYHPPLTKKVNHHPHCLHLWKPIGVEIPIPPAGTLA